MGRTKLILIFTIISITITVVVTILVLLQNKDINKSNYKSTKEIKNYEINQENNQKIDVLANYLPQFLLDVSASEFSNLWEANAAAKHDIKSEVTGNDGKIIIDVDAKLDPNTKKISFIPKEESNLKPGKYRLNAKIKNYKGEDITVTQDFTWGVMAINTNKAIYIPGEIVKFSMSVLDDLGKTKCISKDGNLSQSTAKLNMVITSPSGKVTKLSTDNGSIEGSKSCADRNITNDGDFIAKFTTDEIGKYSVLLNSQTINGENNIDYSFNVSNELPVFEIERPIFPTRIFPSHLYPVEVSVVANQDYVGTVHDSIPSELGVSEISENGKVIKNGNTQSLEWNVNFKKGQRYILKYTIKFPKVIPEFYLIGPLKIGDFSEGKEWQIVSDSVFLLVNEFNRIATSGTTLEAHLMNTTNKNLLILICSRSNSQNFSTTAPSGWTRRWRANTSSPRIYFYDRIATTSAYIGATCPFNTNNGGIGAQMLEFSGNAASSYYDKSATAKTNSAECNSSPFNSVTNTLTPDNPDNLLVSAFASSNGNLTVNSTHFAITGAGSSGFDDTEISGTSNGFNNSTGSYDSGWGEAVNNPVVIQHDVATFSAAGNRCSNGLSSYHASNTISQGSYRFFNNANSNMPSTPMAAVNTPMQLTYPNQAFRIRMLLDIDDPPLSSPLVASSGAFILQYGESVGHLTNCSDVTTWTNVDVASGGTDIAFYTNPDSGGNGTFITNSGNDPSDSGSGYTTFYESYYEDNFTRGYFDPDTAAFTGEITNDQNNIANNQAGLWDISLVDNTDDTYSRYYCLRMADGSGSPLDAYRNYPQITTIKTDVTIRGGSIIQGSTTIR